uniref:ABC transmembrane type-1 domain-containing protein n=1 Tax=Acrobeloides nanus TaxID=290746 RepID=A0A914CDG0_9BILA
MAIRKLFYRCSLFFFGLQIFNWGYSLTKLLAFSERPEQLSFFGIYLSLTWNVLAFILVWAIWHFLINSNVIELLINRRFTSQADDREQLITTDTENNDEDKETSRLTTFAHIAKILYYCRAQWQWYTAGFVFLIIYAGARVFIPHFTGQVISTIIEKDFSKLVRSVIFMSALTLVSTIFGGLRGGCFDYAIALMSRKIRCDLFSSIISQEIAFFDEVKTGEVVSRLTADCQTMSTLVGTNVNVFFRNSMLLSL